MFVTAGTPEFMAMVIMNNAFLFIMGSIGLYIAKKFA